ncbi:MAG: gliding motility-associated C-terminal domain-containing protein [Bacteroidota bacterium]|nr:gliding motility-associated C-terminal domain-containing protein [Bacteroidota bacterium]
MKRHCSKISIAILFFLLQTGLFSKQSFATHAAGGEITYQWISGSTYKVNFIFYRDCAGTTEPATVTLGYANNCTGFCSTLTLNKAATTMAGALNGTEVSIGCPNSQSTCVSVSNVIPGYREWVYSGNVTLPTQCAEWRFFTCTNARNNAINNLVTPGSQTLYVEATLNNLTAQGNSSPFFANKPTPYVCTSTPLNYSNVAIDPNNDSLVYDIIQPRTASAAVAACPTTPSPIAFSNTTLYNLSTNPLDCNNSFVFNSTNGQMTFTAPNQQVAALAVRVREYRNGILIGSIIRDIQVIVRNCINAIAIPNFRLDTASISGGSWIGNRIENCGGNAMTFCISSKTTTPNAKIVISSNNAISAPGSSVSYTNQWSDSVRACFSWTPSALDTGLKAITFTIKDSTCTTPNTIPIIQTYIIPVYITPVTQIIKDTVLCFGSTIQLLAVGGSQFTWSVLPGGSPLSTLSCTNCNNPIASPTQTTQYVVTSNLTSVCNINQDTVTVGVAFVPFPPTTSTSDYCQGGPSGPLQATAFANNTLVWYTTPTGGTGSTTPISPSTAVAGSFSAYVSQKNTAGCESVRAVVNYNINPVPASPAVSTPINYCQGATASALTATATAGNTLRWYTVPTGGTYTNTPIVPSTTTLGTVTYYVSQFSGFCESARVPIVVTVNPVPAVPIVTASFTYCQGYPSNVLTATGGTGATIKWYTSIGGTASLTAPTPTTTSVGTTNYYVTQTNTAGCESNPATITVIVNPAPSAPVVTTNVLYCQGASATPLTATATSGNTLLWYTSATGGVGSSTAPTPSTSTPGVTNYYVSQSVGANCESSRSLITVSVDVTPAAPTVNNITACANTILAPLSAIGSTGNTLLWYTSATGGVGSTTAPTPSSATPGTTTYYVSQKNASNCESVRTPLTVTINATPTAPIVSPVAYCQNATAVALTATASAGNSLNWYVNATGGSALPSIIPSTVTVGTTTYYVSQSNTAGCESARSSIVVTINPLPLPPSVVNVSYCQGASPVALTATASIGNTLNWYGTNATGGVASAIAPTPSATTVGTTIYYVSQTNAFGCQSTRSALSVVVATTPAAPITNPLVLCQNSIATNLTATASAGCTLNWYGTNATGGTASSIAPIPSTNSSGTTTYYVSQQIGTCESPRASLVVTINTTPAAPITTSLSFCQNVTPSIMTATALPGHTLRWYGTNATGGTFTLTPPVINTSIVGITIYYVSQVNSSGCESARAALDVTIGALPAAPLVNPITYCQGANALPLNATALSNHTLNWYGTNATGGVASTSAPTPSTTSFGTITYYVSQVSAVGCESPRAAILVTVNSTPSLPLVSPVAYCQNALALPLSATLNGGTNLNWYGTNASGGSATAIAPTPSTITPGTTTYYVSQSSGASCESARAAIVVTVNPTPAAPIASNVTYCLNATATSLSATATPGNTLWWYTTASGGVGSTTSILPSTNVVGTTTYYVSQKTALGCESNRTPINVTTAPLPSAPAVTPIAYCQGTTAVALTAVASAGHTLNWYGTNATGGTAAVNAPTPTTTIVGSTTYYVSQTNSSGCESTRAPLVVTINPTPSAPLVSSLIFCQNTTPSALTAIAATGNTLNWYGTNASGGIASSIAPIPATSTIGNTTYYVSQTNSFGCESPRAALMVSINLTPPLPIVSPVAYCQNATTTALNATALSNANLLWYGTNATGGSASIIAPIPSSAIIGTTTYYVSQATGTGCESGRAAMVVTINPNPTAPIVSNLTYCQNAMVPALTALASTGNTLNWYGTSASGGTSNLVAPVPATTLVGTTNYYVSQTNAFGCESPRSSLTVTILPTPSAPTVAPVAYCQGSITNMLSATASTNCTLNWYTVASGGSANTIAPTPSSSNVGVTNYYVSQTNQVGCESPRALLSVTINTTPNAPGVNNITYCQGASTSSLTATFIAGNSLLWYVQPVGGIPSAVAPIPSSSTIGSTTYYVSQKTAAGCESPRAAIQVTVVANPTVSIVAQGPTTFCDGDSVKLTATASANVSYQWLVNSTLMPGSLNQAFMYVKNTGLYTVQVMNASGCATQSNAIQVNVRTLPKIIAASGPLSFCSGDSVILSVPILTNVTYNWKFNSNNMINGFTNQIIVRQSGTYTVFLQDVFGCTSTSLPVNVTVNNNPIVNLSPLNAVVCEGTPVSLTVQTNIPGTYTWYLNNNLNTAITGNAPTVTLPGNYSVVVTSAANCKGKSNTISIQTIPLPTIQLPKVINIKYGETTLINGVVTNAERIEWSPVNIISCVNCYSTIVTPSITTTVTGTVYNKLNCSSFDTTLLIVSCDPKFLFIPNLFSPNSDGENDFFYPRAKFDATIKLMQVYNRLGTLVFEQENFKANNAEEGWDGYFKGILAEPGVYRYFIKATCADGTLFDYNGDVTLIH